MAKKAKPTPTPKPKKAAKPKPKARSKIAKKPAGAAKARPQVKAVDYATLAREGDLDALFGLMDVDSKTTNDRLAYKWLCVASDFGHGDAAALIDDVLEVSSLRYDDDQYETAAAHWEIASAYLEGIEGLPVDLGLAKKHLREAFGRHDLATINAGTNESYSPAKLLLKLTGDAWTVLQKALVNMPGDNTDADIADD